MSRKIAPSTIKPNDPAENGFALLAVLWIVTAGALLAATFNVTARSGAMLASSEVNLSVSEAVIDAGLEIAAANLLQLQDPKKWRPEDFAYTMSFAQHRLQIAVADANGFIDLNKSDIKIIRKFIAQTTRSRPLTEALYKEFTELRKDPRQNKVEKRKGTLSQRERQNRGGGADDAPSSQSREAGKIQARINQQSRNKAPSKKEHNVFQHPSDLLTLKNMNLALYKKMRAHVTTYGRTGKLNIHSAKDKVLAFIPNLTGIDVDRFRVSTEFDRKNDANENSQNLKAAKAFLMNEAGPAFIISVFATPKGSQTSVGKEFVILIGLDEAAPYRVLSSRYLQ